MEQYIETTRKKGVHKIGNVYVNIGKLVKDFNRIHTKVNKIKVGGFSCIYAEFFNEDVCKNIQEIEEFKNNIQIILKRTLESEELLCSLMVWFLREHMPKEQTYPLLGNSANAKYTRVITSNKPYNQTAPEKISDLIFKFQIKEESDDLVIDILNTRLINKLFIGEEKSSFMVYTESFMTYIDQKENTFNLDKYQQKIKEPDPLLDLLAVKCMVVQNITYNHVHENVSLKSLFKIIKTHTPLNKLKIFKLLNLQLNGFFIHLKKVGELYGFVHNDCHLGNIFINSSNQLVLIDMGRVYFNFNANILSTLKRQRNADKSEPKQVFKLYEELIEKENEKFDEQYKYETIIQKIKQKNYDKKPIYINPFYRIEDIGRFPVNKKREDFQHVYDYYVKNMYLFDLSTIILNILHQTIIDKDCERFKLDPNDSEDYNFREEVLRIFDEENESSEHASLINNFVISTDKGQDDLGRKRDEVKIELAILEDFDNLLSSKFNLGIYIFAIFVLYVMELSPKYYTEIKTNETINPEDINEDTIVLKRNEDSSYTLEIYYTNFVEEIYCMWHSYQYINIPKIYMFYGYFHKHKDMIEKLKPVELKSEQQGGRKVCAKMPKIPAIPESFNVNLNKNLHEIIDNTFPNDLNNILGSPELQLKDYDFKYKNDTIPNPVPEKAHQFYGLESQEELNKFFQNYIPDSNANKTLYSEIDELFKNSLENTKMIRLNINRKL
jgi:hypothetical protein